MSAAESKKQPVNYINTNYLNYGIWDSPQNTEGEDVIIIPRSVQRVLVREENGRIIMRFHDGFGIIYSMFTYDLTDFDKTKDKIRLTEGDFTIQRVMEDGNNAPIAQRAEEYAKRGVTRVFEQ